ncbi:cupredoxin domain-containing protein [Candidatus Woesearchaeota archaeon]|nr:cupredoxin domain-containing protein [Candidatus Woesearchaeota archaeon]
MGDEININKKTLYKSLVFIAVLIFLIVAFINIFTGAAANDTELVKGGSAGLNRVIEDGNMVTVNLGVANYNYDPNTIKVKLGQKVKIIGNVNQLQGCLKAFLIPDLGISKLFRSNDNTVEFTADQKGKFKFSCSMGMGSGLLIVE